LNQAVRHTFHHIGGEAQTPSGNVAFDQVFQARFVNRHAALLQDGDLARVHIQA
jgi:hypothetical protein